VSGNRILFDGQIGSVAGPSLFWSNNGWGGEKYYNSEVVHWVKQDWNAMLIRAAMGVEDNGGYIAFPTQNKAKVIAVVDAAIANDMYVIIDWHSHRAEAYEAEAVAFFTEMATLYGEYDNVIYEVYNEPLNTTSWSETIKPYAEAVIAAIRAIDPDNLIIVGTPTWSQDVDVASRNPITGYDNIAYALHFYAATHKQSLRNKASTALNNGIALFATEWGSVSNTGDGEIDAAETQTWLAFLATNNISHANWALNDKKEGASALKAGASVTGGWSDDDLTSSGLLVKDMIQNW
jgi:endoglucanase